MLIISNDCSCYPFYNKLNILYNHPFIGIKNNKKDFINTVKYFKNINYLNYSPFKDNRTDGIHLGIIIDNLITCHYIHYTYNENDTRYIRRAHRLMEIKDSDNNIIFIYNEPNIHQGCFNTLYQLCNANNYKLIYCEKTEEKNKNINLKNNILYINLSFKPRNLAGYILNDEYIKNWILTTNN